MTFMGWSLFQIAIGLVILSLLVFVHELGHFLAARWIGVRVITFSVGFGRKVLRRVWGDTEYCISALPFGGYVKLAGQDTDEEEDFGNQDFRHKKIWQRASIVSAGPLANYGFAILVLWAVYMIGVHERPNADSLLIGGIGRASAAAKADIRIGDRILAVNGRSVSDWEQFFSVIMVHANVPVSVKLERQGSVVEKQLVPDKIELDGVGSLGDAGIFSVEKPVVGRVLDSSAASAAGLQPGDTVTAINEKAISSWGQMVSIVEKMSRTGHFQIKRGDSSHLIPILPRYHSEQDRYMIGISKALPEQILRRYGPIAAFSKAVHKSNDIVRSMGLVLKGLFRKSLSAKSVAGPLGIAQMTATAARAGFDALALLLAVISVNLAIINLLPLAITDGGVLLFLLLEKIRGRPFGKQIQLRIQQGALIFFISLFLLVTLNDLRRIAETFLR